MSGAQDRALLHAIARGMICLLNNTMRDDRDAQQVVMQLAAALSPPTESEPGDQETRDRWNKDNPFPKPGNNPYPLPGEI